MNLEKPQLNSTEPLPQRVEALERYLYRLVWELETILEAMEQASPVEKGDGNR